MRKTSNKLIPILQNDWYGSNSKFVILFSLFAISGLILYSCGFGEKHDSEQDKIQIQEVLTTQQDSWNEGNIEQFMEGYWPSDSLQFYSSGSLTFGWENTLTNYKKRYPNQEAMGTLRFDIDQLGLLSPDLADVKGRYHLRRSNDELSGYFSLIFRRIDGHWKIISDITCSD